MATIPNELPREWPGIPSRHEGGRRLTADLDDLNRITLAATCEVLPICRHRGVTLFVRLVSEAIHVRAHARLLEKAAAWLLEEASALASLDGEGGQVTIETIRAGCRAELRMIACESQMRPGSSDVLLAVRSVLEAHGGSLDVTEGVEGTTFSTMLPVSVPGKGELGMRAVAPENCPEFRPPAQAPVPLQKGPDGHGGWPAQRVTVSSEARER